MLFALLPPDLAHTHLCLLLAHTVSDEKFSQLFLVEAKTSFERRIIIYEQLSLQRTSQAHQTKELMATTATITPLSVEPPMALEPRSELQKLMQKRRVRDFQGTVDQLNRDELLDLLAYLLSRGDPNAVAFQD